MPDLQSSPEILRARFEALTAARQAGHLDDYGLEALAETGFRLAVHPATPVKEALRLLHRSVRLDGLNPTFPYHLARLYFLHGKLDQAAAWLTRAYYLCPTSHRVWCHISLLQWELNLQFHGNPEYESDFLKYHSDKVSQAIRHGQDSLDAGLIVFQPPKRPGPPKDGGQEGPPLETGGSVPPPPRESPRQTALLPRRWLNPGQCRWRGVHHVQIEQILEGQPRQGNLARILPLFTEVAEQAGKDPGDLSGFAILGLEWLIAGYPVASVRRLRQTLPATAASPSLSLLDTVCDLFETPAPDLPGRLAETCRQGGLPPLLAALIHQRRLLWQPLKFRGLGAFRLARQALGAEGEAGDNQESAAAGVQELIGRLRQAIQDLRPTRPEPLRDEPPRPRAAPGTGAEVPAALLAAVEQAVASLPVLVENAREMLRELETVAQDFPDPESVSRALADREIWNRILTALDKAKAAALDWIGALVTQVSEGQDPPCPDFPERREALQSSLQRINVGALRKPLTKRVDPLLRAGRERFPVEPGEPTARLLEILAEAEEISSADQASPGETSPSATAEESETGVDPFLTLEHKAQRLAEARDRLWHIIRERLAPVPPETDDKEAVYAQWQSDGQCAQQLVSRLQQATDRCREGLEGLLNRAAADPSSPRPADLTSYKEAVNACLNRVILGPLRRKLSEFNRIIQAAGEVAPRQAPRPMTELSDLLQEVQDLAPQASGEETPEEAAPSSPGEGPDSGPPPSTDREGEEVTAPETLHDTLPNLEQEVDRVFQAMLAPLETYSVELRESPPFQSLRRALQAWQAETRFRLGDYPGARRVWHDILQRERVDPGLLKNLAICAVQEDPWRQGMSSWCSYAEALYFLDILAGSPRPRARDRAEFHRSYGQSFAPAFLSDYDPDPKWQKWSWPKWQEKIDGPALVAFCTSPGRVRNFVAHKLLEFFHARFAATSPPLVLGISRADGERARTRAWEAGLAFLESLTPLFPHRIRAGFQDLTARHLDQALKACASPRRLLAEKDPEYEGEKEGFKLLLQDFCFLKLKLYVALQESREVVRSLPSLDFLNELARLDQVPIGLNEALLREAVGQHLRLTPERAQRLMTELSDHLIKRLLAFIFGPADTPEDTHLQQQQYNRLITDWVKLPVFAKMLDFIDDPQAFYPDEVREGLQQSGPSQKAAEILRGWHQHYPELSGPTRFLAMLLNREEKYEEAIEALSRTIAKGFHDKGVKSCRYQRMLSWFERSQVEEKQGRTNEALQSLTRAREDADVLIGEDFQPAGGTSCIFIRLLAWYRQGEALSKSGNRTEALSALRRARQAAELVINTSEISHERETATRIKAQLDDILSRSG
jgi:tetratricopeptide (TPR) repeat protein